MTVVYSRRLARLAGRLVSSAIPGAQRIKPSPVASYQLSRLLRPSPAGSAAFSPLSRRLSTASPASPATSLTQAVVTDEVHSEPEGMENAGSADEGLEVTGSEVEVFQKTSDGSETPSDDGDPSAAEYDELNVSTDDHLYRHEGKPSVLRGAPEADSGQGCLNDGGSQKTSWAVSEGSPDGEISDSESDDIDSSEEPYLDAIEAVHHHLYAHELKQAVLRDPVSHYKKHPLLHSIADNPLIELGNRDPNVFSPTGKLSVRDLVKTVHENHAKGIALLDALKLSNLFVCETSHKFLIKKIKKYKLTPERERKDWLKVHNILETCLVQVYGPGIKSRLPFDVSDFFQQLSAPVPIPRLILFHPCFLSDDGRVSFRQTADLLTRKHSEFDCIVKKKNSEAIFKGMKASRKSLKTVRRSYPLREWAKPTFRNRQRDAVRDERKKAKGERRADQGAGATQQIQAKAESTQEFQAKVEGTHEFQGNDGNKVSTKKVLDEQITDERLGEELIQINRDAVTHPFIEHRKSLEFLKLEGIKPNVVAQFLHFEMPDFEVKVVNSFHQNGRWHELNMKALFPEYMDPLQWKTLSGESDTVR